MKCSGSLFSVMLVSAALALTSPGAADDLLGPLKEKPDDTALLLKLKGDIAAVTDADDRCRLGVIYCLGLITYGDSEEALGLRDKMSKAFAASPRMKELDDSAIYEDCPNCENGKTLGACAKCGGGGKCPICGGTGIGKIKGLRGEDTPCLTCKSTGTCPLCKGDGKSPRTCTVCFGRGKSLSKDKCRDAYLRLLSPAKAIASAGAGNAGGSTAKAQDKNATASSVPMGALVPPPKGATVDHQVKAVYDALVRQKLSPKLQEIAAYDRDGWNHIALPAEEKRKMIDIQRQEILALSDEDKETLWSVATVRVYRNRAPYGLTFPQIAPPAGYAPDPDIRAVFDENVELVLAQALMRFERRYRTVKEDKLAPDKESKCRSEIWANEFDHVKEQTEIIWEGSKEDYKRRLAEKEREARAAMERAEAAKQEKENRDRQAAQDAALLQGRLSLTQFVKDAAARTRAQASGSTLLKNYPLTNEEVRRASADEYTSIQKQAVLQKLLSRAKPSAFVNRPPALFLPFPSGLKYIVTDVENQSAGDFLVHLDLHETENSDSSAPGALPKGAGEELLEALYPDVPAITFGSVTLLVPRTDKSVAGLRKGQVVTSGEWIITVIIRPDGNIHGDEFIIRSELELEELIAGSESMLQEPTGTVPEQDLVPQGVAGTKAAKHFEKNAEVVMNLRVLRQIIRKDPHAFRLGAWYFDYQSSCGGHHKSDNKVENEPDLYRNQLNMDGTLMVLESEAGESNVPCDYIWEIESEGQLHLLMTKDRLSPSDSEMGPTKVRVVKSLVSFIDSKGFQRTPTVLCLPK